MDHNSRWSNVVTVIFFVCFVLASFLIVLKTYGYEFTIQTGEVNVIQKSLIAVSTLHPDQTIEVYVNGVLMEKEMPARIELLPGEYFIEFKKIGHHSFYKRVSLQPYFVTVFDDVYLVPYQKNLKRFPVEGDNLSLLFDQGRVVEGDSGAYTIKNEHELWLTNNEEDVFINRFSFALHAVYSNFLYEHLFVLSGEKIYICDQQGENCHFLTRHDFNSPVFYDSNGGFLYLRKSGVSYKIPLFEQEVELEKVLPQNNFVI